MTLEQLRVLAENARQRSRVEALQAVHDRLAADDVLERAIVERPWRVLEPELVARAQVVELDPVTLRNLVDAARLALVCRPIVEAAREYVELEVADDPTTVDEGTALRELWVALRDAGEVGVALEVAAARFAS